MNLLDAERLAHHLMRNHGLVNWSFKWDHAKRRFGVCRFGRKEIGLSRYLVSLNNESDVRDTILHEIAHALAGRDAHHGPRWKAMAARIGARPERCYNDDNINTVDAPYTLICPTCGHESPGFKRPRKDVACGRCCRGKYNPAHIFHVFVNLRGGAMLKTGQVVKMGAELWHVDYVNACRARLVPVAKRHVVLEDGREFDATRGAVNVSPDSQLEVVEIASRPEAPRTPQAAPSPREEKPATGWKRTDKPASFRPGTLAAVVMAFIEGHPGLATSAIVAGVERKGEVAACVSRFHQAGLISKGQL